MTSLIDGRGWIVPVAALSASAFAICTAELVVAGLLPALATDLQVDIPTAGLLITGYALGVAIASPVLALATARMRRRLLMLVVLGIFIIGNLLCALATTYWMMLGSRIVVAAAHGLFFGIAMVIAMRLAPDDRKSTAVSIVVAGVTLSNILGIPIGTAIGQAYGWRTTFVVIAVAGALAALIIALLIPKAAEDTSKTSDFAAELRAATRPVVLICFALIAVQLVAVFMVLAYVVPLMTDSGGIPASYVPWVLFGMGVTGFFGNLVGGRLGDWRPTATLIVIFVTVAVLLFVMSLVATNPWGIAITLWLVWLIGFGFPAPVQSRILKAAADAPNFASTLISSAFNVGIACGAAFGGAVIAAGWGYPALPMIASGIVCITLCITVLLALYDRSAVRAVSVANA
jgi:DHA1 family inner membrane transport protein